MTYTLWTSLIVYLKSSVVSLLFIWYIDRALTVGCLYINVEGPSCSSFQCRVAQQAQSRYIVIALLGFKRLVAMSNSMQLIIYHKL